MKLLSDDRRWWTIPELVDELPGGEKLIRKLAACGCFGPAFQPSGPNGKKWFLRDHIESYVSTNMATSAAKMELPET